MARCCIRSTCRGNTGAATLKHWHVGSVLRYGRLLLTEQMPENYIKRGKMLMKF